MSSATGVFPLGLRGLVIDGRLGLHAILLPWSAHFSWLLVMMRTRSDGLSRPWANLFLNSRLVFLREPTESPSQLFCFVASSTTMVKGNKACGSFLEEKSQPWSGMALSPLLLPALGWLRCCMAWQVGRRPAETAPSARVSASPGTPCGSGTALEGVRVLRRNYIREIGQMTWRCCRLDSRARNQH